MTLPHFTAAYPCGCTAAGPASLPNYCPEHGTPPKADATTELVRLVRFVLDKGAKPMWLSDGWREDAQAALTAHSAEAPHSGT